MPFRRHFAFEQNFPARRKQIVFRASHARHFLHGAGEGFAFVVGVAGMVFPLRRGDTAAAVA
jgi:hypothetical protein